MGITTATTSTSAQATGRVGSRAITKLANGNYLLTYYDGTGLKSKEFSTDSASSGATANTLISSLNSSDVIRGTLIGNTVSSPIFETIANQVPQQLVYTSGSGWINNTDGHSLGDTGLVSGFLYQSGGINYWHRHYSANTFDEIHETVYNNLVGGYAETDRYFLYNDASSNVTGIVSLPWNGKVLLVAAANNGNVQWISQHSLTQTSTIGKTFNNLALIENTSVAGLNLAGAVDTAGNAWITYNDGTGIVVRVLDANGSSWTGKSSITATATDTSFALHNSNDGYVWIVWIDSGSGNNVLSARLQYSTGAITVGGTNTWVGTSATRQGLVCLDSDVTQYVTLAWVEGTGSPYNVNVYQAQTGANATFTFTDSDQLATNESFSFGTVTPSIPTTGAGSESLAIQNASVSDSATGYEGIGTKKSQYFFTIVNDNPVRWYRLNETSGTVANDIESGQNGTYTGGFTLNQGSPFSNPLETSGSNSVKFNGTTGFVSLPSGSLMTGNTPYSIELWAKPAVANATAMMAFAYGVIGTAGEYCYLGVQGSPTLAVYWYTGAVASTSGSGSVIINGWNHIVMTYNGTNSTVYLNGSQIDFRNTGSPTAFTSTSATATIGEEKASTDFFNGNISEVMIYAYELSAAQVANHYNIATGNTIAMTIVDADRLTTNDSASTIVIPNPTDTATGTEAVSYLGIVSVTDSGTGLDVPSIQTTFSVPHDTADGMTTPALTLSFTATDPGSGAQTFALSNVSVAITDAGTGAQSPAVSVSPFSVPTDVGTGAQSFQYLMTFPLSDAATGGQSVIALITPPLTDSATGTDSVTRSATYSLTDAATGAEIESTQVNIPISQSATGTDVMTLATVPVSVSTTGAGTGTASMQVNIALAPAGSGGDALAFAVTGTITDVGTGTEQIVIGNPIPLSDSAVGSELFNFLRSYAVADTSAGSETGPSFATNTFTPTWTPDRGTPNETVFITSFSFPLLDAALGAQALNLSLQVPASDGGTGTSSFWWGQNVTFTVSDTATGTDLQSVVIKLPIPDTATGTETVLTTATFSMSDMAHELETPALTVLLTVTDHGTGTELIPISATLAVTDAGTGAETPNITLRGVTPTADSGIGSEQLVLNQLNKPIPADAAAGAEQLAFAATISLPLMDTALGAETIRATVTVPSVSDTGTGADSALLSLARLTLTDTGTGTDLFVKQMSFGLVDGGVGADQVSQAILFTLQDSGTDHYQALALGNIQPGLLDSSATGSEAIQLTMGFTVNDTATEAHLVPLSTSFHLLDNATGLDQPSISTNLAFAGSGTGAEQLVLGTALIPLSNAAVGAESLTISLIPITRTDTGSGVDSLDLAPVAVTIADAGSGTTVMNLFITPSQITSIGVGGDSISSIQLAINLIQLTEQSSATDTISYQIAALAPLLVLRIP